MWSWQSSRRVAQGYGIPLKYRGSVNNASTGAHRANLSAPIKSLGSEIAVDELHHVAFLRTALGAAAPDKPAVRAHASCSAFVDVQRPLRHLG